MRMDTVFCYQALSSLQDANNLLLLHVFNERLVLGTEDDVTNTLDTDAAVIDRTRSAVFSDRYFIVAVERIGTTARWFSCYSFPRF